ncbi:MAG: glycosyltransferase family 2 protein [Thermodesulfobacteriota bacterium]|nr:glycosyltransferase family 2 protein [Thermodesulfobacteriota bacterium]
MTPSLSVLILTKDEERNLPACMDSVAWCDDVHVLDSHSTDNTVSLAESLEAHVTFREFDDWSSHQNWALENMTFKYPWVFMLDADERMTPELAENAATAANDSKGRYAFEVRRRDFFLGKPLRYAQTTPYLVRLFRPERIRFSRLVNPAPRVNGPVGRLKGRLDHYPFSKGISHWAERHNDYAALEARQALLDRDTKEKFSMRKALLSARISVRRQHQKGLFHKLPARPLLKFAGLYFLRLGFLDGGPGLAYTILQSMYEHWIVLKTRELQKANL